MNFDVLSASFEADNMDFHCNEDICGSGFLAFLVPDCPFGVKLEKACFIHDYRFGTGKDSADWRKANVEFWDNAYKLCIAQGKTEEFATILADAYYNGVSSPIGRLIFDTELAARNRLPGVTDGYSAGYELAQVGAMKPMPMPGLREG